MKGWISYVYKLEHSNIWKGQFDLLIELEPLEDYYVLGREVLAHYVVGVKVAKHAKELCCYPAYFCFRKGPSYVSKHVEISITLAYKVVDDKNVTLRVKRIQKRLDFVLV